MPETRNITWRHWQPERKDAIYIGTFGSQVNRIIAGYSMVREVYLLTSSRLHYLTKHSGHFDLVLAEGLMAEILRAPAYIYLDSKPRSIVVAGNFIDYYLLVMPVKCLPFELWLQTIYIEDRKRFLTKRRGTKALYVGK